MILSATLRLHNADREWERTTPRRGENNRLQTVGHPSSTQFETLQAFGESIQQDELPLAQCVLIGNDEYSVRDHASSYIGPQQIQCRPDSASGLSSLHQMENTENFQSSTCAPSFDPNLNLVNVTILSNEMSLSFTNIDEERERRVNDNREEFENLEDKQEERKRLLKCTIWFLLSFGTMCALSYLSFCWLKRHYRNTHNSYGVG